MAKQDKPNIVVIFGDDIGMWNVGLYTHGLMGWTPSIDRIGREGVLFTDHYGQPSCTAGRAAFIMGQMPVRTGMTTIGIAPTRSISSGCSTPPLGQPWTPLTTRAAKQPAREMPRNDKRAARNANP